MNGFWRTVFGILAGGLVAVATVSVGVAVTGPTPPGAFSFQPAESTPAVETDGAPAGTPHPTATDTGRPTPTATPTPGAPDTTETPTATPTPPPTTEPPPEHSDADALPDDLEQDLGTDPHSWDTDGDRIPDHLEVNVSGHRDHLPGADPLHKDLYVQQYWTLDANPPPRAFETLAAYLANLSVANPDGSTGIRLHYGDHQLIDRRYVFDGDDEDFDRLWENYVDRKRYRHVVVVTDIEGSALGVAASPGWTLVFDHETPEQYVVQVYAHELMHNVLGTISGPQACDNGYHYCAGGLMMQYLSERHDQPAPAVLDQLNETGFKPRPDD